MWSGCCTYVPTPRSYTSPCHVCVGSPTPLDSVPRIQHISSEPEAYNVSPSISRQTRTRDRRPQQQQCNQLVNLTNFLPALHCLRIILRSCVGAFPTSTTYARWRRRCTALPLPTRERAWTWPSSARAGGAASWTRWACRLTGTYRETFARTSACTALR